MSKENPEEVKIAEFLSRPGQKFNISQDALATYREVANRVHHPNAYSNEEIEAVKNHLHEEFIAANPGTEMPIEELLKNLDVYHQPM